MTDQAPIVIVGTGLSGYSLVRELRKLDKTTPVVMVTADDGVNYSKPMLSTGFTKGKDAEGLAQGDTGAMAEQLSVDIRTFTTVTGIDTGARELVLGDERLAYSKLVLAWGADVIRLGLDGDGLDRVYSINDLLDYRAFRKALEGGKRVAIMGAGLIGCEFANDLRNGGYEVDVIAPDTQVMPSLLPEAAANAVQQELQALGVNFHLGTVVQRVDRDGQGVKLLLANDDTLAADLVVSAVGLRPRTELARAAGIETGRGILVNRALETSAPDVYALGDCAEVDGQVLLYVLPLMACARALAKTLTGERTQVSYGAMPVMIKTPCCPTAVCPAPAGAEGEWDIEQEGSDVKARFLSPSGEVLGFAVTGRFAVEKQALSREVPPIHSD
ncbi:NAD(P)/FAD-dependent oxidoreductase [Marinobacter sp. UBA3607]|jgi:rubredoxin-NAD+ reductase|uniref:NAD(P)/FAD-dependent oxidoreductase n=1 Tax=Marinobacter sp. UBA3607 TaxID=1946820 RepID=UPI00257B2967|nr:FAD-dependent oxidoreductase [Marinobacter sp. UBA3607]|tara:strand:- start:9846 stop:11003 length:1158 start_codon:yes stop_codon:yes gene_type:complete